MKKKYNIQLVLLILIGLFSFNNGLLYAQKKVKKNKVRIKAQYINEINGDKYIVVKASSKIKRKIQKINRADLTVYTILNDEKHKLGQVTTNVEGEGIFTLSNKPNFKPDSTETYTILVEFKGNEQFKKAKKKIKFKNAFITSKVFEKDSINYITATLTDPNIGPLNEQLLEVRIKRLINPLPVGEGTYSTDESGSVTVPIEADVPGVDGILTLEVVLADSDEYGTVISQVSAPVGIPIVHESTFDERTLWSPRNKTPLFLLIFPNLLIFGIWGLIIYLISNLFKITKS